MNVEQLKQQLLEKHSTLQQRVLKITQDFKKGRSANFAEQAIETENDEVLQNIKAESQAELNQINKALQRIDAGTFGVCEKCGEPIAQQRILALPYSTECIQCASKH